MAEAVPANQRNECARCTARILPAPQVSYCVACGAPIEIPLVAPTATVAAAGDTGPPPQLALVERKYSTIRQALFC